MVEELTKEAINELADHLHEFMESSAPAHFRLASKSMIKNTIRSSPEGVILSMKNIHAWLHKHNIEANPKYLKLKKEVM